MRYLIAGPSHTARWWQRINWKQFPQPDSMQYIYYAAGESLFCKRMFNSIKKNADKVDMIYLFVPDFRFGNNIFEKYEDFPELFIDGYTHPHNEYISKENDKKLYNHGLQVLDEYEKIFKGKIKFIFWCLNYREAMNIKNKKYMNEEGEYRHPVWNLSDLYTRYENAINLIDIQNRIQEFTLDGQGHPSLKAYSFLSHLFRLSSEKEALEIVDKSYNEIVSLLFVESEINLNDSLFLLKNNMHSFKLNTSCNGSKLFQKALESYRNGKFHLSIDYLNELLRDEKWKINWEVYFYLGLAYMQIRNYLLSESMFKIGIKLNANKSAIFTQLGVCFRKKGELKKSKKCFLKSLKINPADSGAKLELNKIMKEENR
ncbi:hypothetical protein [Sulfurimonas sp.]|uniref:tetratricopeptide repeat protein n=1 Tax=Sulfurimonas sp. TaxID=2022749 RepID=UPI00262058B3|nr:hypothetical protein [Sulfurimonas sp.]